MKGSQFDYIKNLFVPFIPVQYQNKYLWESLNPTWGTDYPQEPCNVLRLGHLRMS